MQIIQLQGRGNMTLGHSSVLSDPTGLDSYNGSGLSVSLLTPFLNPPGVFRNGFMD
ncbi:hypothetical protein B0H17DRAFT_1062425 [Mycena rosella]|uniref:Uncharacterized protein n=1 Tax=Mycena rosella TaxID=1033263 RepID=A0AAD7DKJ4_MYCRO|nr:hypothetical protein B0H17DRAFT_1062425 [Mycena rosella]